MKRKLYITCFTLLGVLFANFLSAVIEVQHTMLVLSNYERYSMGLSFQVWAQVYGMIAVCLLTVGAVWGYKQGEKWWQLLYVDQKYSKHFHKPLKKEF